MCPCREAQKEAEMWIFNPCLCSLSLGGDAGQILCSLTQPGLPHPLLSGSALWTPANSVPVHFQPARPCLLPAFCSPFHDTPLYSKASRHAAITIIIADLLHLQSEVIAVTRPSIFPSFPPRQLEIKPFICIYMILLCSL